MILNNNNGSRHSTYNVPFIVQSLFNAESKIGSHSNLKTFPALKHSDIYLS